MFGFQNSLSVRGGKIKCQEFSVLYGIKQKPLSCMGLYYFAIVLSLYMLPGNALEVFLAPFFV
jgi:hypothetical protein